MSLNKDQIVEDLKKILGGDKVSGDALSIKLYSRNAVYMQGDAIAVVFPTSTQDVSKIVRYCFEKNLRIYPQGSASELVGSSTPHGDGIIVSFVRMNRIKEKNYIDSYVMVEPGLRLVDLNEELSEDGYMFPVDPASVKSASVGGAVNSGAGGMMGAKYGTMKDWVLGLEAVLPDRDGTVLKLGGRTTKNREGYDLVRLIIGSEGTLAIVTEAILKITVAPERIVSIAGFFPTLEDLMKCVIEIKKRKLNIFIMEFVDELTAKTTIEVLKSKVKGEGAMLITSVATTDESAEKTLKNLEDTYIISGASSIYKAYSRDEAEESGIFEIRRNYYPASIKIAAGERGDVEVKPLVYGEDISVPPTKLVEAIDKIRKLGEKYNIPMTLAGHISDGNIHPVIWLSEKDEARRKAFNSLVKDIMKMAIDLGGVISSEHGIGLTKREELVMAYEVKKSLKAIDLMKKIKKIFDPKNILNPDKIFLD